MFIAMLNNRSACARPRQEEMQSLPDNAGCLSGFVPYLRISIRATLHNLRRDVNTFHYYDPSYGFPSLPFTPYP